MLLTDTWLILKKSIEKISVDFQSAICLTKDQIFYEKIKHIDVRYHYIRDVIAKGDVKVCNISTHDNPADMMTKSVIATKFTRT